MGQDGERLAVCETKIENLELEMKNVREDVKSINRTIWLAMGGLTVISFLLNHWLK